MIFRGAYAAASPASSIRYRAANDAGCAMRPEAPLCGWVLTPPEYDGPCRFRGMEFGGRLKADALAGNLDSVAVDYAGGACYFTERQDRPQDDRHGDQ